MAKKIIGDRKQLFTVTMSTGVHKGIVTLDNWIIVDVSNGQGDVPQDLKSLVGKKVKSLGKPYAGTHYLCNLGVEGVRTVVLSDGTEYPIKGAGRKPKTYKRRMNNAL